MDTEPDTTLETLSPRRDAAPGAEEGRRQPGSQERAQFELRTFGHATLVVLENGEPLIATDPWLVGSVYWRSWWLEQYPTPEEFDLIAAARYVYITHSHPDHFHPPTLRRMGSPHTLHPAFPHYPVPEYLRDSGIQANRLAPFRWYAVTDHVSIMSAPTFLDDSILVIDTPHATVVDVNDSNPSSQLLEVLRDKLTPRKFLIVLKSYSPASSAVATYRNGERAPLRDKRDYVRKAEEICQALGATHYIPFASQAFFSRTDSQWANEYKVFYRDLVEHWSDPSIELCPPFVHLDLGTGTHTPNRRAEAPSLEEQHAKTVQRREQEEAAFTLPGDFAVRLTGYLASVRFLRLIFRRGIGFRLTTSGTEWFYNVWSRSVEQGIPDGTDIVISLPDKVLYEALVNGILTDLGITMLIRVDSTVDVRRAYAAFSLMGLRDYKYSRGLPSIVAGATFYAPMVLPKLLPNRYVRRLQEPPAPLPQSTGKGMTASEGNGGLTGRIEVACNLCGSTAARPIRVDNDYQICRCTRCGLVYVDPQPHLLVDEDVHYLRDTDVAWDPADADGSEDLIEGALDDLAHFVGDDRRLLDVGCGYGLFLAAAQRRGWECFGIDVSEVGVAYARDHFGLGNIRRGHLMSAAYPSASFDAITMFNLLEHVSDPRALLEETVRLLRPGGVLLVRVPNMAFHDLLWTIPGFSKFGKRAGLVYLGGVAPPQHLFGFKPHTLVAMLESVGLEGPQLRPAVPHFPEDRVRKAIASGTDLLHQLTFQRVLLSPTMVAYATKREC
jgi:SAM-dependent methyltransferase